MDIKLIKKWIIEIAQRYDVAPVDISMKLLSKEDKQDLINEKISRAELEDAINVWVSQGCQDFVCQRA
jgi:hypothetical protein